MRYAVIENNVIILGLWLTHADYEFRMRAQLFYRAIVVVSPEDARRSQPEKGALRCGLGHFLLVSRILLAALDAVPVPVQLSPGNRAADPGAVSWIRIAAALAVVKTHSGSHSCSNLFDFAILDQHFISR